MMRRFWPTPLTVSNQEKLRMLAGTALGMLFVGVLSRYLGKGIDPWLVAPIGASAVLVFGVPSSPLAQPWAVVGGNTLSALIGTAIALVLPDNLAMAAALAVALAIAVMLWGRCLHPPGGAAALLVVLAHKPSFDIVLFPFLLNSVLLVVAGLVYNNLTARPYPHHSKTDRDDTHANNRFTQSDLNAALEHYQQIIDVDPADLAQLLQYAESAAYVSAHARRFALRRSHVAITARGGVWLLFVRSLGADAAASHQSAAGRRPCQACGGHHHHGRLFKARANRRLHEPV